MNLTPAFVTLLKQKLTVASSRSILLNALPGRLISRLPLNDLGLIKKQFPAAFLESLTSKNSFQFKIVFDLEKKDEETLKKLARTNKRIAAIKYDHDDYFKEHGVETFGFGFPILVRKTARDPEKYIAAPVFIFPLSLKQSFEQDKEWIISRSSESEIRVNEVLLSYLESEEHIKLPELPEEMLDDGLLDKAEIETYCRELMKRFSDAGPANPDWNDPEPVPDKMENGTFNTTRILWNGVFGIYKGQKQSLINEMDFLLSHFEEIMPEVENTPEWPQPHSPMITDPSQNGVLRSLQHHKDLVIQGPPGTGKSQTLTAIIASALANEKKVLVVCEKRTALEVLENNLKKLIPEAAGSIGLIEDVTKDRTAIVETVRNHTAIALLQQHNADAALKEDIHRFETKALQVQAQYEALKKPVWRQYKWPDIVGQWLAANHTEQETDELYVLQQHFGLYKMDAPAFDALTLAVQEAVTLFQKIKEPYAFLEQHIKPSGDHSAAGERALIHRLRDSVNRLEEVKTSLQAAQEKYRQLQNAEIRAVLESGQKEMLTLQEMIAYDHTKKEELFAPTLFTRIKAWFSKQHKDFLARSAQAVEQLQKVSLFWSTHFKEPVSVATLQSKIDFLQQSITIKTKEKVAGTRLTLYPETPAGLKDFDPNAWADITREIEAITEGLSSMINTSFPDLNHVSIDAILTILDNEVAKIKAILKFEHNIRDYFSWKSFLALLDQETQAWLALLLPKDTGIWKQITEQAWLYHKLIQEDERNKYPADDSHLHLLKELGLKIQTQQKEKIKANLTQWFNDGQQKIKAKGIQLNQLYNLRGAKGSKRNSLRTIVHTQPDAFTDFFPVLMLNPTTCSSLLPLQRGMFDIVIFDEASQLRVQDTFGALLRGRQVVVSGDSQQMPPSGYFESTLQLVDDQDEEEQDETTTGEDSNDNLLNESSKDMAFKESLLEFAIDMGFRETYLDMHYRSRHPDLIEFSNASFYNNRLIAMPAKENSTPIKYTFVNGVYENRQNEAEAKEIVRILKEEIDARKSVGVATFNLQQRNLILNLINQERIADPGFREKMDLLEQNGFFVKNLENIQGDEKDIILISTTFGTRKDGSFALRFGPVGQQNGHRLLNVILTRAKHELYVFTSIPETRVTDYRTRLETGRKVDGTTGLLAYLAYAKAVSTGNNEEKKSILEFITAQIAATTPAYSPLAATTSVFEQEVYRWLKQALGPESVSPQYACGGFTIDLAIHLTDGSATKKLAITCDGAAYHTDQVSWHYDIYHQEQLEQNGFACHRIWSANWWRNPDEEFIKLMKVIEQLKR